MEIKKNPNPTPPPPKEEEDPVDIEELIKQELEQTPMEAVKSIEQKQKIEESEQVLDHPEQPLSKDFTVNLDPLDPYFSNLHEKTSNIEEYFTKEGTPLDVGAPNHTDLQIAIIEGNRTSCFTIKYHLQCSYSFYQTAIKDDKLLTTLSPLIAESKTI